MSSSACARVDFDVRMRERRPGDPAILVASNAKAKSILRWRSCHDHLEQIVQHARVMATMFGMYPFLMKLYADGGYHPVRRAVAKIMARVNVEIVKRSDHAKGFVASRSGGVVERTFAWLGRCRRLAKDWENLNRKALAFLGLASIRFFLRKLCNPA